MSDLPAIVRESLRGVRKHLHEATDNLSEILTGAPENELATRIQFVVRDLSRAQDVAIEALRYYAEYLQDEAMKADEERGDHE